MSNWVNPFWFTNNMLTILFFCVCGSHKLSLRVVLRAIHVLSTGDPQSPRRGIQEIAGYRRPGFLVLFFYWLCGLGWVIFSFGVKLDNLQVASSAKGLWVCKCCHVCYLNRSHSSKLVFLKELNVGVLPCVSVTLYKESIYGVATEPRRKWCKEGKKPFCIHCSSFTKFSIKDWLLSQMRSGTWKP